MGIRVGILGGGIAGMTAAHELALRGFEVHVFDKRDIPGGKARSYYRGEGIHERRGMPGEHGFRFFPGFYQHLPDTMSRIPFPGNKNGVLDNLVGATKCEIARQGHRAIITPIKVPESFSGSFSDAYDLARCLIQFLQLGIKPQEVVYYLARLIMFASSCEARRINEFEKMSWWDFIGAKDRSINYKLYLATGMTRTLVAAQADKISARSGAQILLQLLFNIANPFRDADRVLNGPTEEVWIWPWYEELIRKGVKYYFETEVLDIECVGNRIGSVTVCGKRADDVPSRLQFDFYVASLPVEVFRELLTPEICAANPSLYNLHELNVANMNGVQFYLREDVPLSQGHTIYVDSKWGLTSISQQQFWRNPIAQNYGDGRAAGILSVDVSNWEGIGILYGKPLKQLHTTDEVKNEVWAQLKAELNTPGATVLEDSNLVGFNVDIDIREKTNLLQLKSNERLLINTVGSLFNRPHAYTKIENLFLASDYVRTNTDLATMEAANEAARRAVNAILEATGSQADKCAIYELQDPLCFRPLQALDWLAFQKGARHPLDRSVGQLLGAGLGCSNDMIAATGLPRVPGFGALFQCLRSLEQCLTGPYTVAADAYSPLRDGARSGRKTRIAILGGGMGSIATAFQLTSTPALRAQYEVTVYQLGWRIGGKGASGRNQLLGDRIEEHGLHVWFGCYDNAFTMMRECYNELGRPESAPLAKFEDAFKPCDSFVLFEEYKDTWIGHPFRAPHKGSQPGEGDSEAGFWDMASTALAWLRSLWADLASQNPALMARFSGPAILEDIWAQVAKDIGLDAKSLFKFGAAAKLELARGLAEFNSRSPQGSAASMYNRSAMRNLLMELHEWLREAWDDYVDDDDVRFFLTTFDLIAAVLRGVIDDRIVEKGLSSINDKDFRAWLRGHGAREITLENSVFVRMPYSGAFAFLYGDVRQPNLAAGVAVSVLLQLLFAYKGAFLYKMQAGMGDTVFAPFYEVLKRRGVKFEFFNAVEKLHLSPGRNAIESIDVVEQVQLAVAEYDPLILVRGLPCWPSEPRWEQIVNGPELREAGVNLEEWPMPEGLGQPKTLQRGIDFDKVVLGISVAALSGDICAELYEDDPKFRDAIDHSHTTMTQAFQLWMNEDLEELGWPYMPDFVVSTYVEPLDTYADMSHLIKAENWSSGLKPSAIAYFCGVLQDTTGENQQHADARVLRNMVEYLRNDAVRIWLRGRQEDGDFDWQALIDPAHSDSPERLSLQYWRANFQPSERYVQTPAGSVKYRLKTDGTKYSNLFVTGDWIECGTNVGAIESAVIAGMLAARAITGSPHRIRREDDKWLVESRIARHAGDTSTGRSARRLRLGMPR